MLHPTCAPIKGVYGIRQATKDDAIGLAQLHQHLGRSMTLENAKGNIEAYQTFVVVDDFKGVENVSTNGKPELFNPSIASALSLYDQGPAVSIGAVATHPRHQHRGLASSLVKYVISLEIKRQMDLDNKEVKSNESHLELDDQQSNKDKSAVRLNGAKGNAEVFGNRRKPCTRPRGCSPHGRSFVLRATQAGLPMYKNLGFQHAPIQAEKFETPKDIFLDTTCFETEMQGLLHHLGQMQILWAWEIPQMSSDNFSELLTLSREASGGFDRTNFFRTFFNEASPSGHEWQIVPKLIVLRRRDAQNDAKGSVIGFGSFIVHCGMFLIGPVICSSSVEAQFILLLLSHARQSIAPTCPALVYLVNELDDGGKIKEWLYNHNFKPSVTIPPTLKSKEVDTAGMAAFSTESTSLEPTMELRIGTYHSALDAYRDRGGNCVPKQYCLFNSVTM